MTYTKKDQTLEVSDQFLYLEEIYLCYPNRWELFRSKTYASKSPINKKNSIYYSETHGCNVQRYWELVAAPKQYLLSNGFKLKL